MRRGRASHKLLTSKVGARGAGKRTHYLQFLDAHVAAQLLIIKVPRVSQKPRPRRLAPSLCGATRSQVRVGREGTKQNHDVSTSLRTRTHMRARTHTHTARHSDTARIRERHAAHAPSPMMDRWSTSRSRRRRSVPRTSTSFLQNPCACGVSACALAAQTRRAPHSALERMLPSPRARTFERRTSKYVGYWSGFARMYDISAARGCRCGRDARPDGCSAGRPTVAPPPHFTLSSFRVRPNHHKRFLEKNWQPLSS